MVGQSFAIIAVILVMSFLFIRTGKRSGAVLTAPLVSVSLFHLLGSALYRLIRESALPTKTILCATDIAGLLLGVSLCAFLSRGIVGKRLRLVYFICCTVFLFALTVAYILYLTR